jgi:hypothetical protein
MPNLQDGSTGPDVKNRQEGLKHQQQKGILDGLQAKPK